MKYNSKDIKKLGRAYGKRAFKLTEDDFIELSQIEQAYLAGYKKGRKNVIDKACEYLRGLTRFVCCSEGGGIYAPTFSEGEINLFRKKMED